MFRNSKQFAQLFKIKSESQVGKKVEKLIYLCKSVEIDQLIPFSVSKRDNSTILTKTDYMYLRSASLLGMISLFFR